jgi:hypothetical protein
MIEIVKNKPYVYTLAYPNGIVFYVGKGTNDRIYDHEWIAAIEDHKQYNSYKSRAIRKIWREGGQVKKDILAYFDVDQEAFDFEVALIFFMRPYGHLCNLTDGGEGAKGLLRSEESRKKLSDAKKGSKLSEEAKRKISEANKGKIVSEDTRRKLAISQKGRVYTAESKQKMSNAWNGRPPISEETRRKQSEAHKGRRLSEEARRNIAEAKKKQSEETRKKNSDAHKGRCLSEETKRKISDAHKGRVAWNKGIPMKEEQKIKLSKSKKSATRLRIGDNGL